MQMGLGARATEAAYVAQQLSLALPSVVLQRMARSLFGKAVDPPPNAVAIARKRFTDLLTRDLANVREGLYPRDLLFQIPVGSYARNAPRLLFDLPRVASRRRRAGWRELPTRIDVEEFPPYFRRTFHWQTDGYLSRRSAQLYDVGVEFLFGGTADVMRRQVIPPITRHLRTTEIPRGRRKRLLDVGCGTGRTLDQIHVAHPALRLFGLDLSPFYVREARARLSGVPEISLVAENAEAMPWKDAWFDAMTSVYLFHELPRNARRNVMREMYRVLAPGGIVVIEDSAQPSESPELELLLDRFPDDFHEPFYADYLRDPIEDALREVGFEVGAIESHFVAKVVIAHKPES